MRQLLEENYWIRLLSNIGIGLVLVGVVTLVGWKAVGTALAFAVMGLVGLVFVFLVGDVILSLLFGMYPMFMESID